MTRPIYSNKENVVTISDFFLGQPPSLPPARSVDDEHVAWVKTFASLNIWYGEKDGRDTYNTLHCNGIFFIREKIALLYSKYCFSLYEESG